MALLFPVLAFPVLLSRPAWSEFSDSELELLCAQELCCPDEEDCLVSDVSLMVFFVSVTLLKGEEVRSPLKPRPQDRWRWTGGTCLCLHSGSSKLGQ